MALAIESSFGREVAVGVILPKSFDTMVHGDEVRKIVAQTSIMHDTVWLSVYPTEGTPLVSRLTRDEALELAEGLLAAAIRTTKGA